MLEVVVVLGLIVLLAAIVVPIFGGIERRHRRNTCLNNLRAIGEALAMYREDYRAFPPDASENWGSKRALGLFFLNYLAANPDGGGNPATADYTTAESDYLRNVTLLHCPANPVEGPDFSGVNAGANDAAYLGGYNAYDWYYRRHWDAYLKSLGYPGWPEMGRRHLRQAFPPDNTVVTWCTMHRNAQPGSTTDGLQRDPERGDHDLVLFADGTVEALPASKEQFKAQHP